MFVRFFEALFSEIGLVLKMFRSFFTRIFTSIYTSIRRVTSLVTQAFKLIPALMSKIALTGKKPARREDYIETRRLFISKSLIFFIIVGILLVGLAGWFLVRPLLVRWFFTADYYYLDKTVEDYTGKVRLYYDEDLDKLKYVGKLENGVMTGEGSAYDTEGNAVYVGEFAQNQYEGTGKLWENGVLIYSGQFSEGERNGEGNEYIDGILFYRGGFEKGVFSGDGSEYDKDGNIIFRGQYVAGKRSGRGTEYYINENHTIKYSGEYLDGQMDGSGILSDENERIIYDGSFRGGKYNGDGTLYFEGAGNYLTAAFEMGVPTGDVKLYSGNRMYYSGEIDSQTYLPQGYGILYDERGVKKFEGRFADGNIDGSAFIGMTAADIRSAFDGSALTETDGENGFTIYCASLGVTAFCSYKTETDDALIRYAALSLSDEDKKIKEAIGSDYFEASPQMSADDIITAVIPLISSSDYYTSVTVGDDYLEIIWSEEPDSDKLLIEWCAVTPHSGELSEVVSDISNDDKSALNAEKRLEALLEALKLVPDDAA